MLSVGSQTSGVPSLLCWSLTLWQLLLGDTLEPCSMVDFRPRWQIFISLSFLAVTVFLMQCSGTFREGLYIGIGIG